MRAGRWRGLGLLLGAVLPCLGGCSFGPLVIRANTQRYNEALVQSEKKQFLLNLVRLRYRDRPKVIGVSAINSQFSFFAEAPGTPQLKNISDPFHSEVTDAPTITFSPLGGPDFTLGLLKPIPLGQMVLLVNTGWDLDRVMRLLVHTLNGLENAPRVGGQGDERAPQFAEFTFVARQLGELQQRGLLEFTTEHVPAPLSYPVDEKRVGGGDLIQASKEHLQFHQTTKDGPVQLTETKAVSLLRIASSAWNVGEVAEAGRLLKLAPTLPAYRLVEADEGHFKACGTGPRTDLLISMRSLLSMGLLLSKGVEIPEPHYRRGLVAVPVDEHGQPFDWTEVTAGLFRVRVQKREPLHSFVAVKYRGWWYYIADDDLSSKSTMQMVMELYDLQTVHMTAAPVLTLPINASRSGP